MNKYSRTSTVPSQRAAPHFESPSNLDALHLAHIRLTVARERANEALALAEESRKKLEAMKAA